MQEIAANVFVETGYPGVTLGALTWSHGLILIDAPFRPDDVRTWRAALQSRSRGRERLLVNLDEHYDRTLGAHQFDCMVAGHEKMIQLIKDRPVAFKPQLIETGAEWELHSPLVSVRWAPPDITFSDDLVLHWDETPLHLEYHPGPSSCAIWATLPAQKICFLGDLVSRSLPPFLANADIPAWVGSLEILLKPEYKSYILVSGRSGFVTQQDIKGQIKVLGKIEKSLEKLSSKELHFNDINKVTHSLLKLFDVPKANEKQYSLRIRHGMILYLRRKFGTLVDLAE